MLQPELRLRQAIIDGNLLVVKRLLKRFPDLLENIDSSNGWSSLHYAAYNGRYLICVHLISLGHDKNEILRTFKKNSSVHLSLLNGHEQTTHLLLQHFPTLLNSKGEHGHTPLHISSIRDHFKCVDMLLGLGADINSLDDEGNNALHLAMKYGSLTTIRLLVQRNIDTNHTNETGLKPIEVASSFQTEKFFNDILNNKSPNEEDEFFPLSKLSSSNSISDEYNPKRSHSNSLPPVTTGRRPSTSSMARSPIPRTAVSSTFTGSNSSSYVYSPVASHFQTNLTIKPPNITNIPSSGSPVLYSPVNVSLAEATELKTPVNSITASFPSMTSLASGGKSGITPEPTGNRSRAQSTQFISINKTRSNSGSKNQSSPPLSASSSSVSLIPKITNTSTNNNNTPIKITPTNSATSLSRTSTGTSKSDSSDHFHFNERSRNNSITSSQHHVFMRSRENSIISGTTTSSSSALAAAVAATGPSSSTPVNSTTHSQTPPSAGTFSSIKTSNRSRENSMNSKIFSNFENYEGDEGLRLKLTEKFDSVTNDYKKRNNGGFKKSILNIPIASLNRNRETEEI